MERERDRERKKVCERVKEGVKERERERKRRRKATRDSRPHLLDRDRFFFFVSLENFVEKQFLAYSLFKL